MFVVSRPVAVRWQVRQGFGVVGEHDQPPDRSGERAERRAAREAIGDYHEARLRLLLERGD